MEETPPPGPAAPEPADEAASSAAARHFAARPDAELFYLARHAAQYPPAVGAAAVAELQRRGLVPDAPAAAVSASPPADAAERPARWGSLAGQLLRGLLPSRTFWATPALLNLNLLVFFLMMLSGVSAVLPTGHELARWGSNVTGLTLPGQPWRLLSSLFIHAGFTHLLLNMLTLWLLGLLIEARTGPWRLLLVYLVSGVVSGLASLWWHAGGVNSVGASGAIFGLYGLQLVILLSRRTRLNKFDRRAALGVIGYLVLSNLISGLTGNIDNAAHLGGLLAGLAASAALALAGTLTQPDPETPPTS